MIRWIAAAALGAAAAFAYDRIGGTGPEGTEIASSEPARQGLAAKTPTSSEAKGLPETTDKPSKAPLPDPGSALPFPIDLEARFSLTDHNGRKVTEADYAGETIAVFFGYANCESVCSAIMPDLAKALEILDADGRKITPLLITVDPKRDSPAAMKAALPRWHKSIIGLTGSQEELQAVWDRFQVDHEVVGYDEKGGEIYTHGSLVYLIGKDSKLLTILPPVYGPEHMARIFERYL